MAKVTQIAPFLRESRSFPFDDIKSLSVQCDRSYVDVAQAVNTRTIGIFALDTSVATGENWYLTGPATKQQTIRKLFKFTPTSLTIPHGIDFATVATFTHCWGCYTDANNQYYGLIFASDKAISGNYSFYIDSTNINIIAAGAHPTLTSGIVVIEWLSLV